MIKPGRYKHYKGGIYTVLFVARDTTTCAPYVVYMNELHGTYYCRHIEEFTGKITTGEFPFYKPRFEYLGD